MEQIKGFFEHTAAQGRAIMLRNRQRQAFDIHVVHYTLENADIGNINDVAMAAISTRFEDQVDDSGIVGFDELIREPGIIFPFSWLADNIIEGTAVLVSNHTIVLNKPIRVPWLSFLFNIATVALSRVGVEVWFEAVKVSAMESADLTNRIGGRPQSPPS